MVAAAIAPEAALDPGMLVLKFALVIFLVLLNGFFVAAEFALVKIRDTQLDRLIQKGNRRAQAARHVLGNLDRYLSAAQLGITVASLALGALGEPLFTALLQPVLNWLNVDSPQVRHTIAVAIGLSVMTFLHITAGEQAPKWMAIQKPLPTSLAVVYPLKWFYLVTFPFIWVLNQSSLWMLRRLGIQPASEAELHHSEEELRLLFTASQKHSAGTTLGKDIVLNALDLRRRVVRDVMRPRPEIIGFDTQASLTECIDVAEKTRFSRFPLCEHGDIDRTLGVIHIKDLYAARFRAKLAADLAGVARKIIYVPETARLEKLLQLFLERKLHFAIVVDEFGGTVGMVTLENILEEVVGQIQDEFDQEKPLLVKKDEQTWEVLGTLPVHDLEELVGEKLSEEGVTTASGWVTNRLGGFPKAGDTVHVGTYELRVEDVEGLLVARMSVRRLPEPVETTAT
jgi:CBS domain containing-hemolysin-like protein